MFNVSVNNDSVCFILFYFIFVSVFPGLHCGSFIFTLEVFIFSLLYFMSTCGMTLK